MKNKLNCILILAFSIFLAGCTLEKNMRNDITLKEQLNNEKPENPYIEEAEKEPNKKSNAIVQLEKVMVYIISDELSIKDIMININELGFNNENIEMQLKAFFKEASKQDIIKFSNNMYNKVMDVNKCLLEVIVDNIKLYKEPEVENLLMEIYMSASCSKEILNTIDNYWS